MTKFTAQQIKMLESAITFSDGDTISINLTDSNVKLNDIIGRIDGSGWGNVLGDLNGVVDGDVIGVSGDIAYPIGGKIGVGEIKNKI